jgi:phospholipid transport system substrate-binding protein
MFLRRSIPTLVLAGWLAGTTLLGVFAQAAAQKPHEIVQETSDEVLKIISERGQELEKDPRARKALVDQILGPVVDFEVFSQLVLGRYWRTATPAQRERFLDAFHNMLVRTYTKSLSDYAGTEVIVLPSRGEQHAEYQTVYTEIRTGAGESPLSVNYSFRLDDNQWRAYDLTINGLSLVQNFRSSFGNEIERHGLQALIQRLERGGQELAPDTPL